MAATCEYCGKEFESERSSAKYCSDACKSRYHRLPGRVDSMHSRILEALEEIRDLQQHEHLILKIDSALRHIRDKATEIEYAVPQTKIIKLENERDGIS